MCCTARSNSIRPRLSIRATSTIPAPAVPERLRGADVTWRWFEVFGAKARLGRTFRLEEDRPSANREVVLSYAAWKRLFGQDAGTIGKTIELNQMPYRIVGVMGPEFRWPADVDLWVPLGLADSQYTEGNRFNESYAAMARLKPGLAFTSANAFVEVLSSRLRNSGTRERSLCQRRCLGHVSDAFHGFHRGQYQDTHAGAGGRGRFCAADRLLQYRRPDAGPRIGAEPRGCHPRRAGSRPLGPHPAIPGGEPGIGRGRRGGWFGGGFRRHEGAAGAGAGRSPGGRRCKPGCSGIGVHGAGGDRRRYCSSEWRRPGRYRAWTATNS